MSTVAERDELEARLASLLDVDAITARRALAFCGYDFEVAVDVVFTGLGSTGDGRKASGSSSSGSSSASKLENPIVGSTNSAAEGCRGCSSSSSSSSSAGVSRAVATVGPAGGGSTPTAKRQRLVCTTPPQAGASAASAAAPARVTLAEALLPRPLPPNGAPAGALPRDPPLAAAGGVLRRLSLFGGMIRPRGPPLGGGPPGRWAAMLGGGGPPGGGPGASGAAPDIPDIFGLGGMHPFDFDGLFQPRAPPLAFGGGFGGFRPAAMAFGGAAMAFGGLGGLQRPPEAPREPPKKKSKFTETSSTPFRLSTNESDEPAENPAAFTRYPLREEQLKSLAWMVRQERGSSGKARGAVDRTMRGGLLADAMGYGKTATTIGLISLGASRKEPLRTQRPKGYVLFDSTLVVCPDHLVLQWETEFVKFLGEGVSIWRPICKKSARSAYESVTILGDRHTGKVSDLGLDYKVVNSKVIVESIAGQLSEHNAKEGDMRKVFKPGDVIFKIEVEVDLAKIREIAEVLPWMSRATMSGRVTMSTEMQIVRFLTTAPVELFSSVTFTMVRSCLPGRINRTQGNGPLKVLVLESTTDLYRCRGEDFLDHGFQVVLACSSIQRSTGYMDRIRRMLNKLDDRERKGSGLTDKVLGELHDFIDNEYKHKKNVAEFLRCHSPIFEVFWWTRIVLDEFHESGSWEFRVRELLKAVGATHRWGLSGTPPLGNTDSAALVAQLLWYTAGNRLQEFLQKTRKSQQSVLIAQWCDANQDEIREDLQKFLDIYVRQNRTNLVDAIAVKEHECIVDLTPEERLIYRQACHDNDIFDLEGGYQNVSLEVRAALLQRCAHFDLRAEAGSAGDAVKHLGCTKRQRIQDAEAQLRIEASRAAFFKVWPQAVAALSELKLTHEKAASVVKALVDAPAEELKQQCLETGLEVTVEYYTKDGELRLRPEVRLQQPIKESEYFGGNDAHRHAVVHAVARHSDKAASAILGDMHICGPACNGGKESLQRALLTGLLGAAKLLEAAHRSLDFYEKQLQIVSGGGVAEECPICLDDMSEVRSISILPCAHVFHTECIREILRESKTCPTCRMPVDIRQISPMAVELKKPAPAKPVKNKPCELPPALRAHGSKLNAIAAKLTEIRREDPAARVIVFMQWARLETRVAKALGAHGLKFVTLAPSRQKQSAARNGRLLRDFQNDDSKDSPWILLLSLDHAAAGTNLTSASHVLFVHPMNAESVEVAAAYERQAIGRIRRVGQKRPEVHVWRFKTRETVEEHVWGLHQAAVVENPDSESEHGGGDGVDAEDSGDGGDGANL